MPLYQGFVVIGMNFANSVKETGTKYPWHYIIIIFTKLTSPSSDGLFSIRAPLRQAPLLCSLANYHLFYQI